MTGSGLRTIGATRMNMDYRTRWTLTAAVLVAGLAIPSVAEAQLLGHNTLGDFGLYSGSQAAPGFYLAPAYIRYDGDRLVNASGESIERPPELRSDLDVNSYAIGAVYVTDKKFLGANVGFTGFAALVDNKLVAPVLGLSQKVSVGITDLYIQPLNLGWHTERADILAGVGVYVPTGEWSLGGSENRGMGMWSFELSAGSTVYLDRAKNWHVATTAYFETHTKKRGTDIRVGDVLTLEGGLGRAFMGGAAWVGVAYYAQWKLSEDRIRGLELPGLFDLGKHRGFGVGPEATFPVAIGGKLRALITGRYLWETGVRSNVEGQTLVVLATVPIPSPSLE